ncbi:MAG: PD-(D/E)XK nuclease family protein [Thermodesulfobacteriota bacterium]
MAVSAEFLTAPSRAELDLQLLELMERQVDSSGIPQFLYLSPTRRKNREMAEKFRQRRVSWLKPFFVPVELAERILEKSARMQGSWVSPELKTLAIHHILEELRSEGRLQKLVFHRDVPLGVARHVVGALDALVRHGFPEGQWPSGMRPELRRDLDLVRTQYDRFLREHSLQDPLRAPETAAQVLSEDSGALPFPAEVLILDGFVNPDYPESLLLSNLVRKFAGSRVVVTVPKPLIDHVKANGWEEMPPEFGIFRYGRSFLEGLGLSRGTQCTLPASSVTKDAHDTNRLGEIVRYPDRASEAKGIARAIKRLFFDEQSPTGLKPEDFHVVVPKLDTYYQLFIEIFPRYGIPFNITRGIPLSSIPVVGLLLALMEAALQRTHEALFRFFSSQLVAVPVPEASADITSFIENHAEWFVQTLELDAQEFATIDLAGIEFDVVAIDRVCRDLGVRGGRDFVNDWLAPFATRLKRHMLEARHGDEPDGANRSKARLRELVLQLWLLNNEFQALDRLESARTAQDLFAAFEQLVLRYDIEARLVRSLASVDLAGEPHKQIFIEKNVKGFSRAMGVLAEIRDDLTLLGQERPDLRTALSIFRDRCRRVMIQEAGALAGVNISQTLELRNLSRPVVFLAGLTADDFPSLPKPNFILPRGVDGESIDRAMAEARFIFTQAMKNSGQLFLSYPSSDGADPLEPSPFILDLLHGGRVTERTESGPEDEQFSSLEILEAMGKSWPERSPLPWDCLSRLIERLPEKGSNTAQRHEEIRRALMAGLQRSTTDRDGPYDGMIADEAGLRVIHDLLDDSRFAYSYSMLNEYVRCPLAFFFARILALAPIEEIPEEPEAREIGRVVHAILAEFYRSRIIPKRSRIHSGNRLDALVALDATARSVLEEHYLLNEDSLEAAVIRRTITRGLCSEQDLQNPAKRREVEEGQDIAPFLRGPLRRLADYEAALDLPLYPVATEYSFGTGQVPPLTIAIDQGRTIRIQGVIDRIDRYQPNQGLSGAGTLWIYDYKTGSVPTKRDARSGEDLQLPVYTLALLDGLGPDPAADVAACFVSLKPGEEKLWQCLIFTSGITSDMLPDEKSAGLVSPQDLDYYRDRIRNIDEAIRRGEFPRTSKADNCERCLFQPACFRDEYRVHLLSRE